MGLFFSSLTPECSITKIITNQLVSNMVWNELSLKDLNSCSLVNKLWHSATRDFMKSLKIKFKIQAEFPCRSLKEFNDFLSSQTPSVSLLFNTIETPLYAGWEPAKCVGTDTELHQEILVEGAKASELFPGLFSKLELKHFHFSVPVDMDGMHCPIVKTVFRELFWHNANRLVTMQFNAPVDEDYRSFLYGIGAKDRGTVEEDRPLPVLPRLKRLGLCNSLILERDLTKIVGSAPQLRFIHGLVEPSLWGLESLLPSCYYPRLKQLYVFLTCLRLSQLQLLIDNPVIGMSLLDLFKYSPGDEPGLGLENLDFRFNSRRWEPRVITLLEQQSGRLSHLSCTLPQLRLICRDCKVPLRSLEWLEIAVGPTEDFFNSGPAILMSIPNLSSILPRLFILDFVPFADSTTLANVNAELSDLCDGSTRQLASLRDLCLDGFDESLDLSSFATFESLLSIMSTMPKVKYFSCNSSLLRNILKGSIKNQNQGIPWDLFELALSQVELDLLVWEDLFHVLKPGLSSLFVELKGDSNHGNPIENYAQVDDGHIIPWFSSELAQEMFTVHPRLEIKVNCFSGSSPPISLTSFEHLGPSVTASRIGTCNYKVRLSGAKKH